MSSQDTVTKRKERSISLCDRKIDQGFFLSHRFRRLHLGINIGKECTHFKSVSHSTQPHTPHTHIEVQTNKRNEGVDRKKFRVYQKYFFHINFYYKAY